MSRDIFRKLDADREQLSVHANRITDQVNELSRGCQDLIKIAKRFSKGKAKKKKKWRSCGDGKKYTGERSTYSSSGFARM